MRKHQLRREDGQTLLLIMLVLPLLLALSALVVDGANGMVQRRSMQSIADAAALAAAQDLDTTAGGTCNAACVTTLNKYTSDNGMTISGGLVDCSVRSYNCYAAPYKSNIGQIEVRLRKNVSSFFGRAVATVFRTGLLNYDVSARAVGVIANGPPPQLTFAALSPGGTNCDNHTLVIRSSGILTVNNNIYVDTCNGRTSSTKGDGFDIFGTGGCIRAKDIFTYGGWETHTGLSVFIPVPAGPGCSSPPLPAPCPLTTAGGNTPYQTGCPHTGQPALVDPFAGKLVPPPLDKPVIPNSTCSAVNPCYNVSEFSPPYFLDGSINNSTTTVIADGKTVSPASLDAIPCCSNTSPPNPNAYISVDGERMGVTHVGGAGTVPGHTLTVTRAQLGTVAAAHNENAFTVVGARRVSTATDTNLVTLTTSQPHDLNIGDWVKVNLSDNTFDGVFQVTEIPDDETATDGKPVEFEYVIPGNKKPDVGAATIRLVRRTNGEATVTTTAASGINVNDPVVVDITSGDTSFDETLEDRVKVDSVSADGLSFSYAQPGLPDVKGTPIQIDKVQRQEGNGTIFTDVAHGMLSGDTGTVSVTPDSSFNGHFAFINVAAKELAYPNSGPDVAPDVLANAIKNFARSGGTVTITTGGLGGVTAGTYVVVHVMNDASFDGTFKVMAIDSTLKTFQYTQAGPDVATTTAAAGSSFDNLVPIASYSRTGGVAQIVTTANNGLGNGQDPIIQVSGDPSFDAAYNVTAVSKTTFTYASPGPDVPTTAGAVGDGVSNSAKNPGTPLDVSGSNPMSIVTPDNAAASGIVGSDSINCSLCAAGPLFEIFNANSTQIVASSKTNPAEYKVPAGTLSPPPLNPGTYYGGICIGAPLGASCGSKVGGTCAPSSNAADAVTQTLNPGIYIMAGGGFFVCGNATLNAPGVMIYNTVDSATLDPGANASAAALDQVKFNTNGNVHLSAVQTAPYSGMTIYQGPDPANIAGGNKELSTAKCDGRQLDLTDIALLHTGNGLDGFEGTIYAPADNALFRDTVSGTATLAVITGCIFIDGANSTFNFDAPPGDPPPFGIGYALSE